MEPAGQGPAGPAVGRADPAFRHRPAGRRYSGDADEPIVDAVQRVAEARGIPMAQVALAWVLQNPVVTAPIVGPTKPHHLADAVAALDVSSPTRRSRARGALHAAPAHRLLTGAHPRR